MKRFRRAGFRLSTASMAASVLLVAVLSGTLGCHRSYYRQQADAEAYALIGDKAGHPHWRLEDYTIEVDPASRMFDPFNPDTPPMPPDDPQSHRLMHHVDGKKGYPGWHYNGETPFVENPAWMQHLPLNENGVVTLDAETAIRLALLNARDYQQEFEELYLSALDVSAERFRFDTQFFGGYSLFYTADGPDRAGSGGQSRSTLAASTFSSGPRGVTLQRTFATGADLVVGLANSLVWQFSGPDTQSTTTLLDFALVQPLLRGAGRDRVLETLTIAERALLANVRQMERFRRGFYTEIITGSGGQPGATRRGGFFGGSGLTGFSGVGGGGFGRVGAGGGGGGGGFGGGGAGAAQAGGFMGLLQDLQSIRNLESNIAALRSSLAQLEAFYDAGRINFFQVELARQDLYQNQSQLLNAKRSFQDRLDGFKLDLGLPPQLPVVIEDDMLDQFNLIEPTLTALQNNVTDVQQDAGRTIVAMLPPQPVGAGEVVWNEQTQQQLRHLKADLQQAEAYRRQLVNEIIPRIAADIDAVRQALPQRRDNARQMLQAIENGTDTELTAAQRPSLGDVDPSLFRTEALAQLPVTLSDVLASVRQRLEARQQLINQLSARIDAVLEQGAQLEGAALAQQLREQIFSPLPSMLSDLAADALELSLIQARARAESVMLVPVEMDWETALEIARRYRRDWMNARAALVDAWRLIEFNADNLESTLDIVFSGDVQNLGDNPLRLRGTTGRLRVGVQFDAPITRLLERNTYRQSLIEYQQARRSYYAFEDGVAASLRGELRQIQLNQVNFELRRAALRVAVNQVESARLRLQEPPRPSEGQTAAGQTFGDNTARDLVQALSSLRNAQDNFLSVWVNYEVLRRVLDLDLGTMQLDEQGMWIDPGPIGLKYGYPPPELLKEPLDHELPPELLPLELPPQAEPIAPGRVDEDDQAPLVPPLGNGAGRSGPEVVEVSHLPPIHIAPPSQSADTGVSGRRPRGEAR